MADVEDDDYHKKFIGTLLLGIFFNTYLYGLVIFQNVSYYLDLHTFDDPLWLRATIVVLFFNDTIHSAAQMYWAYVYCVTNYANPDMLEYIPWPFPFTPIAIAISGVLVHHFLAYRLSRLTANQMFYYVISGFSLGVFAVGIATGIWAWQLETISQIHTVKAITLVWLCGHVVIDLFNASSLSVIQYQTKTGFMTFNSAGVRLFRGCIQTGVAACFCNVALILSFVLLPNTNFYGMFAVFVGRIYTTTLMDTILSREKKVERRSTLGDVTSTMFMHTDPVFAKPADTNIQLPTTYSDATELSELSSSGGKSEALLKE